MVRQFFRVLLALAVTCGKLSSGQLPFNYTVEDPLIVPGSRPIERLLIITENNTDYQCVQKCYPIVKPTPPPPPPRPVTKPIVIRPPVIPTTRLPVLKPCQLVCLRYPYSEACARCYRPKPVIRPIIRPVVRPVVLKPPAPLVIQNQETTTTTTTTTTPRPTPPSPVLVQPPPRVIYNQMRCCYLDKCFVFPLRPACPSICYEPCNAICTGRCLPNPTCPGKCQEVTIKLRQFKVRFMMWLHAKLDEIRTRHRQQVEMCILRTRASYMSEVKQLQMVLAKAHPLLQIETEERSMVARRSGGRGISINILGQQNIGGAGRGKGKTTSAESGGSFHVNQNIGINNNEGPQGEESEEYTTQPETQPSSSAQPAENQTLKH